MGEKFLRVISLTYIEENILNYFEIPIEKTTLPVFESLGYFTSEDIYAKIPLPPFKKSLVDGYAVRHNEVKGASAENPVMLKLLGKIEIGSNPIDLTYPNSAVYVPTGGAVPLNADAVVMIENTELVNDTLFVYKTVTEGENIFNEGEEIKSNTLILKKGERITPKVSGILNTTGNRMIPVYKKVKVGFFSTGSELTEVYPLPIGKIYDFNNITLHSLLIKDGFNPTNYGIIEDSEAKIKKVLKTALDQNDIVLMTGGTSKGELDFTVKTINELGNPGVLIHGINVSPGKPTIFASISNKLVIGLSGNPLATFLIYSLVVKELIYKKLGFNYEKRKIYGILSEDVNSRKGRDEFILGKLVSKDNKNFIEPILADSSFSFAIKEAQGYFIIPSQFEGITANSIVEFYFFD
ncbi:MAG: molybdopterin molybdotransferase MoeA [Caldisericaceae bacterium]